MTTIPPEARTRGELRQRLRRFASLGLIDDWEQRPDGSWLIVRRGEVVVYDDGALAWAYLDGVGAVRPEEGR